MKAPNSPSQTSITDFFDTVAEVIQYDEETSNQIINICGNEEDSTGSVLPILQKLYQNAQRNVSNISQHANKYNSTVKTFAAALYGLIGRSGYEMLTSNLGPALSSLSSVQQVISKKKRLLRENFYLTNELKRFKAPHFINIHLDDTTIINKIEYDQLTGRFVGFCLPLKECLPPCNAFCLKTFEEIKSAFDSQTVAKYAHCIIAQPIDVASPSFVLFVLGTDSTYTSNIIVQRWIYIEKELNSRGVKVISFGAGGAGPFMKAMADESRLFQKSKIASLPDGWDFFLIPRLP